MRKVPEAELLRRARRIRRVNRALERSAIALSEDLFKGSGANPIMDCVMWLNDWEMRHGGMR